MINYWNVIQRTHREKDNQELLKYLAEEYLDLFKKWFSKAIDKTQSETRVIQVIW